MNLLVTASFTKGRKGTKYNFADCGRSQVQLGNEGAFKVAVARRRNGSDGVALGTVATARNGYLKGHP